MARATHEPRALARVLGVRGAVLLGLGSIVGTGVFLSLSLAAAISQTGLLLALLFAAVVALANGLSSAALAAAHPVSGGTYEYGYRLLHPAWGHLAGTTFLLAKSASGATAALGAAAGLLQLVGGDRASPWRVPLACTLTAVLTVLVAGGLKRSHRANALLIGLALSALCVFIAFGFSHATAAHALPELRAALWPDDLQAFFAASALLFVAFTGYGRIATLGEEVHAPERTIPRAMGLCLGAAFAVYAAVLAAALALSQASAFAALGQRTGAPLQALAEAHGATAIAGWIAIGASAAMLGVLLNLLLGLSRVTLAMARRQDLPPALAVIDPKQHSPRRAVFAIGALIGALVLLGEFRLTWSFSAFTVLVYYGITNAAALRLRLSPLRRASAIFGLLSCVGLAAFLPREIALWSLGLIALSLALRWFFQRRAR